MSLKHSDRQILNVQNQPDSQRAENDDDAIFRFSYVLFKN